MRSGQLSSTVRSMHVLAEHVLGAGLYAVTGHIGLAVAPGGFGTPVGAVDQLGGRWSVAHGVLVLDRADGARQEAPITTVRSAAQFFGATAGMPATVYPPATPFEPDAPLAIDRAAAERIGAWLALGAEALAELAGAHAEDGPTPATLWPEHFDLGLSLAEVNYGVSPGDDDHAEPYLYVGPWSPRSGEFWNEPFGASVAAPVIGSVADAMVFFEQGRACAAAEE